MNEIEQGILASVALIRAGDAAMAARDQWIASGLRSGMTARQLAQIAQVSHSRVRQIAVRNGIKLARGRPPAPPAS